MGEAKGGRHCAPIGRKAIRAEFLRHFIAAQASNENRSRPAGFESWRRGRKKPATGRVTGSQTRWCPQRDVRVRLAQPASAASLRSLRAAQENASRFLSSAPLRVRIPPLAHKKAPWAVMGLGRSVLMAGTEGFEPPTAGTKNRSSTVELRPNVWCCPKATRLVYLICEGIANAVE